ncbi:MAG: AMP-binding protein [Propionibacteriaceae bacterium]|nr:AMP-binding protein [Propionibacteriaceae bacterium]
MSLIVPCKLLSAVPKPRRERLVIAQNATGAEPVTSRLAVEVFESPMDRQCHNEATDEFKLKTANVEVMLIETVAGETILQKLEQALAGETVIGVVPEEAPQRYLEMLRPSLSVEYEDAAVIVPTSGSTGSPKGVVLSATALLASAHATHARLGGSGHWVCALPIHHIAGLMTLVRGIASGCGTSYCRPDLNDLFPAKQTPSYLSLVATQLERALDNPVIAERLTSFAAVLVGGSAIPAELIAKATYLGINAVTTYGMSETCGGCVYDGLPLAGVDVQLESDSDRILLSGEMVFSGYRLEPELTSAVLNGKQFRTQDRGMWVDGKLQVVGRFDDVIITGGVNVDLAEVQRFCDEIWGIAEPERVVVFDVADLYWGRKIIAATGSELDYAQMRKLLEPNLQIAAIPKELIRFVAKNTGLAGKIDKAALRKAWMKGHNGDSNPMD